VKIKLENANISEFFLNDRSDPFFFAIFLEKK